MVREILYTYLHQQYNYKTFQKPWRDGRYVLFIWHTRLGFTKRTTRNAAYYRPTEWKVW